MVFEKVKPETPNESKNTINDLFWARITSSNEILCKIQEIKIKTKTDFEKPIVLFA